MVDLGRARTHCLLRPPTLPFSIWGAGDPSFVDSQLALHTQSMEDTVEIWTAGGWRCLQVWDMLGSPNLEAKQAGPHSSSAFLLRGRLAFNKTLQSRAFLAGARNRDVKANGPCYSQAAVWCVVRFWGPDESCERKSCEVSSSALCTKELWVLDNSPGTSLPIDDHITFDLAIQDLQSLFRIPLYN